VATKNDSTNHVEEDSVGKELVGHAEESNGIVSSREWVISMSTKATNREKARLKMGGLLILQWILYMPVGCLTSRSAGWRLWLET
jgi:hypothetical protein